MTTFFALWIISGRVIDVLGWFMAAMAAVSLILAIRGETRTTWTREEVDKELRRKTIF
jgi:hypothetical protein